MTGPTMIFGYIFSNRIQPFEAANISAAFFLCMKHYSCHKFLNKFQDDISFHFISYILISEIGCISPSSPINMEQILTIVNPI